MNWLKLLEVMSQGELHWSHEYLVVSMKSVKSDWFGHITWKRWKTRPKASILERLDKRVLRLEIWKHNIHIFDFLKHKPNTPIYRLEGWSSYKEKSGKNQLQKV